MLHFRYNFINIIYFIFYFIVNIINPDLLVYYNGIIIPVCYLLILLKAKQIIILSLFFNKVISKQIYISSIFFKK